MSVCIECGREMDWAEAEEFYFCERCRSAGILAGEEVRVPTMLDDVWGEERRKRRLRKWRDRDALGEMWLRDVVEGWDGLEV